MQSENIKQKFQYGEIGKNVIRVKNYGDYTSQTLVDDRNMK